MKYNTTLEQDIDIARKLITYKISKIENYSKLYSWTNELLRNYFQYENLNGKKAACVTSSGDHIIHASMAGAKQIDAFDINPLAKYYSPLKISILKTYDYKNMTNFLWQPFLRSDIEINDFKEYLNDCQIEWWKAIIKTIRETGCKSLKPLFKTDEYTPIEHNCAFFNEKGFKIAQEKIHESKINYYDLDIMDPDQIGILGKYNAIFLSNIHEYGNDNQTKDLIRNCWKLLLHNGILYQYNIKTMPSYKPFKGYLDNEKTIITLEGKEGHIRYRNGVNIYRKKEY